jgi:short-subunit dehydrogenase
VRRVELRDAGVLLTGASSGIGAAAAEALARRGARLALVARREPLLKEVAARCRDLGGPEPVVLPADLVDLDTAQRVALEAEQALGGVDVLVNNAGIPKRRPVLRLPFDDVVRVMHLNYLSPVRITLTLLPRMVERGRGMVVNVASLAGRIGAPAEAAYAGSKFALTGFSESAQIDLAGTGVGFAVIQPGPIDTAIWHRDLPDNDPPVYEGEMFPTSDVAAAIVDAVERGGFERFIPPEMRQVVAFKAGDIDTFLAGSIAYTQKQ